MQMNLLSVRIRIENDRVLAVGQVLESLISGGAVLDDVPKLIATPLRLVEWSPVEANLSWSDRSNLHVGWSATRCRALLLGVNGHDR